MVVTELEKYINELYDNNFAGVDEKEVIEKIDYVFSLLNSGKIRVAEKKDGTWGINSWIKKSILLAFRYKPNVAQNFDSFDKLGLLKFDYEASRYRKVPGAIIRDGVFIDKGAVIMPSYINVGAYIGKGSMIDINSVIGSCAQIGCNCHISALACIGGVLEPVVANPVIIENNCFIGAQSSILEGVIVEENSVIASGVTISGSTKIVDRETGAVNTGIVRSGSVIVSGSYPSNGVNISCAVVIKKLDSKTKLKSSINDILRDNY